MGELPATEVGRPDAREGSRSSRGRVEIGLLRGGGYRTRDPEPSFVSQLITTDSWRVPVVVRRVDRSIVDGRARVSAAARLGRSHVEVEWFDGSADDARLEFVRRNAAGRDRLTIDERVRAVETVLAIRSDWSDRRIGEVCGTSPKSVARARRRVVLNGSGTDRRIGRDGRTRPVDANATRAQIADAVRARPAASLREIAGALGVSPETVRKVRLTVYDERHRIDEPLPQRLVLLRPPTMTPWRDDRACASRDGGAQFVSWFDETNPVLHPAETAAQVPISRVYEIADEARRRADWWTAFARELERRPHVAVVARGAL